VPLFVRGIRSLALTPAGARLAIAADGWLAEYGTLADELRGPAARPVTVTATIGIAALWLVPRLSRFQDLHPDVDVRLAAGNRILDLAREGIDLAVRYCAERDAPAGAAPLFGESTVPVASPALAARRLDRDTLPDTVLLDFDDVRYPWLRWGHWLTTLGLDGVRPRAVLVFNQYDQLIQAAVAGQGVAIAARARRPPDCRRTAKDRRRRPHGSHWPRVLARRRTRQRAAGSRPSRTGSLRKPRHRSDGIIGDRGATNSRWIGADVTRRARAAPGPSATIRAVRGTVRVAVQIPAADERERGEHCGGQRFAEQDAAASTPITA